MGDESDAAVWEEIGREALALQLTQTADAVGETARPLAQSLQTGDELPAHEVQELQEVVDELDHLVTHLETVSDT